MFQISNKNASRIFFLFGFICLGIFVGSLFIIKAEFAEWILAEFSIKIALGCILIPLGINFLLYAVKLNENKTFHKEIYRNMTIFYAIAMVLFGVSMFGLFGKQFSYWIIRSSGAVFEFSFYMFVVFYFAYLILMFTYLFIRYYRLIEEYQKVDTVSETYLIKESKSTVKVQLLSLSLILIIGSSGFIFYGITYEPTSFSGCVGASDPYYDLPTSPRFNTNLDSLTGDNQTLLLSLEKALWSFTQLRQPCGGFPIYATTDFCNFIGDGPQLWPNEISLQDGTPLIGAVYLKMYELEPNPIYLQIAKDIGNALVKAQDPVTGGYHKYARFNENNEILDPQPRNPRRHASFDDNTMQGVMIYLLLIYNATKEQSYLDALDKGFDFIEANQYSWGAWPQETNFIYPQYHIYSTLNDGLVEDMITMYLTAIEILPDRTEDFRAKIDKLFDWLSLVQGNGGSELQKGAWAQQYDFNNQPVWARSFEPPAMESSGTAGLIKSFIDLYCFFNDSKYLEPIPDAISWLVNSKISWTNTDNEIVDGWARIYELETNLPIYGLAEGGANANIPYVYSFDNARSGYGWRGNYGQSAIDKWNYIISVDYNITKFIAYRDASDSFESIKGDAFSCGESMNEDGFWIRDENKIHCTEFSRNSYKLMNYISLII